MTKRKALISMRISTFFYTLKQGIVNIFRNKWYSLASLATITTCLLMFGVFYSVVMNFQYISSDIELEEYAGKLNKDVELVEEINKLFWIDKTENFFDMNKFAGNGNIGHMICQAKDLI